MISSFSLLVTTAIIAEVRIKTQPSNSSGIKEDPKNIISPKNAMGITTNSNIATFEALSNTRASE